MSEGTGSDLFEDFQSFSENPEEGETQIPTDPTKPGRKNSKPSGKHSSSSNSKQKMRKTSAQSQPSPLPLSKVTEGEPGEDLPSEVPAILPSEPQPSNLQPAIGDQIPNETESAAGDSDDLFEDFEGQTPGKDVVPETETPEIETLVVVEPKELSTEQEDSGIENSEILLDQESRGKVDLEQNDEQNTDS